MSTAKWIELIHKVETELLDSGILPCQAERSLIKRMIVEEENQALRRWVQSDSLKTQSMEVKRQLAGLIDHTLLKTEA